MAVTKIYIAYRLSDPPPAADKKRAGVETRERCAGPPSTSATEGLCAARGCRR